MDKLNEELRSMFVGAPPEGLDMMRELGLSPSEIFKRLAQLALQCELSQIEIEGIAPFVKLIAADVRVPPAILHALRSVVTSKASFEVRQAVFCLLYYVDEDIDRIVNPIDLLLFTAAWVRPMLRLHYCTEHQGVFPEVALSKLYSLTKVELRGVMADVIRQAASDIGEDPEDAYGLVAHVH